MEPIKISNNNHQNNHSVRQLTEDEKNFAAAHLNEDDSTRAIKIQEIRDWILNEEKLNIQTDDFTILRFLRCCKFNMKKTKNKIHNYYQQRIEAPEWFSNRNPFLSENQAILNLGCFLPLLQVDHEGKTIILLRPTIHDPQIHPVSHVIKGSIMILDLATKNNVEASLHGVIVIMDMTGVSFKHALQLTPSVIQQLVHAWQDCYPIRINSINIVNAPIHINVILNIFKRFMKPKLRARITVSSSTIDNFFAIHFPQSTYLLPIEYGGEMGTLQQLKEYWKNETEANSTWYIEEENH